MEIQNFSETCETFSCDFCDYSTRRKSDLKKHLLTKKHDKTIVQPYFCSVCDYKTSNKHVFFRHCESSKHLMNIDATKFIEQKFECVDCGKLYGTYCGLWKHKKKCSEISNKEIIENDDLDLKKLVLEVVKQNNNLTKHMMEMCKESSITNNNSHNNNIANSHNKTFNLQFFLNETCKDALNLGEFVENIKISLQDLENVGSLGYVEGISKIIVNNLNNLEVNKRPIHCSDVKREIIHVKDNNVWEKEEEDKMRLVRAIKTITHKNISKLPEWKEENPHYRDSESKLNDKYMNIVNQSMGACDTEGDTRNYGRIIRTIANETKIKRE